VKHRKKQSKLIDNSFEFSQEATLLLIICSLWLGNNIFLIDFAKWKVLLILIRLSEILLGFGD
jgi:hypothetical protein